jgi:hypothetical protein
MQTQVSDAELTANFGRFGKIKCKSATLFANSMLHSRAFVEVDDTSVTHGVTESYDRGLRFSLQMLLNAVTGERVGWPRSAVVPKLRFLDFQSIRSSWKGANR